MPSGLSRAIVPLIFLACFIQKAGAQLASDLASGRNPQFEQASTDEQVFQSFQRIQAVCTNVDGGKPSGEILFSDADGAEDLAKTCHLVAEYMKRRDLQGASQKSFTEEEGSQEDVLLRRLNTAENDANIFSSVDDNPDNDMGDKKNYPSFIHPEKYWYPYPHVAVLILIMALVVFLWETLLLQSTACPAIACCGKTEDKKSKPKALGQDMEIGPAQVDQFWKTVDAWGASPLGMSPIPQPVPCVRFMQRVYRCFTDGEDGRATIGVQRTGPCTGELIVHVKPYMRDSVLFSADAGDLFDQDAQDVRFAPGQNVAFFEVPVYGDDKWDSGKLFMVRLDSVVSGTEILHTANDARVFIIDSHRYPGNAPDEPDFTNSIWLAARFWQECYNIRGCTKVTKTFIGLLVKPFQSIVVTSLVTKYVIDWASRQEDGTASWKFICMLGVIQFTSWLVARWADQLQVQNRGRTGGIRQTHRRWLFDKLMIVGQTEHWRFNLNSAEWFYAAVNDVNSIVTDVYWQVYVIWQNIFGVFLTLCVLVGWDIKKASSKGLTYEGDFLLPCLILILLVPMSLGVTWYKKGRLQQLINLRTVAEADWMDYWSWLAHSVQVRFGFSFREISAYEKLFADKNADFVKKHGQARDWKNDSEWIVDWMTYIAYMAMLIWGALALTADRYHDKETATLTSGEFAVLLSIFAKVGSYVIKLNDSISTLHRGLVSLRRVQTLLNEGVGHDDTSLVPSMSDRVEISRVNYVDKSDGYFGSVSMQPGKTVSFQLGSMVRIDGTNEKAILGFLAVMGKMVSPGDGGSVEVPDWCSIVMAGEMPAQSPACLTVSQEIMLVGACDESQAKRLALVFGLNPGMPSDELLPANAKILLLIKALLRDPDILILARPFAFVSKKMRPQLLSLLRLWQRCGGSDALVSWSSGNAFVPQEKGLRKTVVMFEDTLTAPPSPTDVVINLDDYTISAAQALVPVNRTLYGLSAYHVIGQVAEESDEEFISRGVTEDYEEYEDEESLLS